MDERIRKKIFLMVLVALAAGLSGLESLIPNPLPWVRLGLTNAVTLLVMILYGFREALAVTLARVFLVSLVLGGLLGPSFLLSLGGGLVSVTVMALMYSTGLFSILGLSVGGAFAHTLTQFGLLFILIVKDWSLMTLAPPFLLLSLPTGALVGWLVIKSWEAILHVTGEMDWESDG